VGSIPDSPLGKAARYPDAYDPGLLYPVERAPQREALGIAAALPFSGVDRWTAWEATWLDLHGRPRVAIVTFDVPCTSPRLVESKSVKLWLTSLNGATFDDTDALRDALQRDLARATGAPVDLRVHAPSAWAAFPARGEPDGVAIDDEVPRARPAAPDASVLACADADADVEETLFTRGFRSVCPVTGQPDYAHVIVAYRGRRIVASALAGYLAGFRHHPGFHEHCVERIFVDLTRACRPAQLRVEARFTRRGGVDINPVRAAGMPPVSSPSAIRQ
jgi:7-cyano-7-deazaguanine reductase